jgi:glycosyltransferase involved in cell wall biosynthesis
MKLSVVIPVAGKNYFRDRNFKECLRAIRNQTHKDYEIIVVEQSLDNRFYKDQSSEYKLVQIKDPYNRGFNLSWCRNVGARNSLGDKIILMDADMVFEEKYFEAVIENKSPFAGGANYYYWLRDEFPTNELISSWNFESTYKNGGDDPNGLVFKFETFTRGCGFGAVLVFERKWYFESFGGYCENFFRYGWEDKAGIEVIKNVLGINNDSDLPKVNYKIVHLGHANKDYNNLKLNENIFNSIKFANKRDLIESMKSIGIGDTDVPKLINNLCQ